VQGRTTIFQSDICLKNEEKQKSHFLFFDSGQVMDDLFRASLSIGKTIASIHGNPPINNGIHSQKSCGLT